MSASSLIVRRRRKPEINIIPLMDISVKLIFFFLVSMQFKQAPTLNLTLPKSETAGQTALDNLVLLSIDQAGAYYLADRPVTPAQLASAVDGLKSRGVELNILIRSDEGTPLQKVLTAMDIFRQRGLNRIRLQTR